MAHRPTLDDASWYFTVDVYLNSYNTGQNTIMLMRSDFSVWRIVKFKTRERVALLPETTESLNS